MSGGFALDYPKGWLQTTPRGVVTEEASLETGNRKAVDRERKPAMDSILIAHRDVGFAEELATQLRASGYFTIVTCPLTST